MTKTKLFALVAGVAIVLGLVFAPVAKAQTSDATIASLLAQIQALTAQLNGLKGGSTAGAVSFTKDLTVGSTGAEVTALQNKLGVVPATGYFGAITKAAVQAYQAEKGISATGFVGPMTRAALNAGAPVVVPPTTGGTTVTPGTGREGSLKNIDTVGGIVSSVEENQTAKKVLAVEVEAKDSNMTINRVDVELKNTDTNSSTRPNHYFDTIALMAGGKKVADISASDLEKDGTTYSARFSNLNIAVADGKTETLYVAVDTVNSIDSDDESANWTVSIPADGIRAVDEAGISDTYPTTALSEDFSIGAADTSDVVLSLDTTENKARTVAVEESNTQSKEVVYTSSIESKDADSTVTEVRVTFATTSAALYKMLDSAYLYIDGQEIDSKSIRPSDNGVVTFSDLNVDLAADDEVSFVIKADVAEQGNNAANYADGSSFKVTDVAVVSENNQGDEKTATDSTNGGVITLRADAVAVEPGTVSAAYVSGSQTKADYAVNFKITAPADKDIWLALTAATGTASSTGANFKILSSNDTDVSGAGATTASTSYVSLERVSGGTVSGGYIKVSRNNSATLAVKVGLKNLGAATDARLKIGLSQVNYSFTANTMANALTFTDGIDEDYQTSPVTLYTVESN